jgi:3-hydroxybutyryl-CoA dehydrogenase
MKVAVVGAGIMGSGIAQLAAMAGHDTSLTDVSDTALARASDGIDTSLARLVKAGRLDADRVDSVRERLRRTLEMNQALDGADIVVEAVTEVLDVKQQVLARAVEFAKPDAVLGTNTSQLSITAVGSWIGEDACRVVGMHFFNPPVMMRLVELVRGLQTDDVTVERARAFAEGLGKEVVVCQKDSPGFLTSRISAILRLEAMRMLEEGLASAADIDKAIRLAFNHPMGPLELGDFNGLDTYLHAVEGLSQAHGDRFRATVGLRNMVAAGHLGRKTGRGFYAYGDDGKQVGE